MWGSTQIDLQCLYILALLAINFGVYYPRNFIFRFPIDYNWSRGQLCSLKKRVGCSGFEHGHMENWMDRMHRLWKIEGE